MDNNAKLALLKQNLQMTQKIPDSLAKYLQQQLDAAVDFIRDEGITLTDSAGDTEIHIMYAAYLYRSRAEEGEQKMPRMLRLALNNRKLGEINT